MGQIIQNANNPIRCNIAAIQSGGSQANTVLANGEIWLVDTTNADKGTNGYGVYDSYIKGDGVNVASELEVKKIDDSGGEVDDSRLLPKSILPTDDGLYQLKYGTVFPVAHPALSTQPSVLPQSFGNLDIMEVLISNGRESEIPSDAVVIMATSFNDENCCPAVCKKVNGTWAITNSEGFTPDFTLVQYVQVNGGGYYGGGGGSDVKRDSTKDIEIALNYDNLPQSKRYLAVTADSANTENAKVSWSGKGTLFMSKNLIVWRPFNADNSLAAGETLYLSGQVNKAGTITCDQPHDVSGNPMSLYHLYDFDVQALKGHDFEYLFSENFTLVNAKNLSLPATTLIDDCYNSMFQGCTSLTTAPELPATTLAQGCYMQMFQSCTSLTTTPQLPATTLAGNCYNNMFQGCTSLTTAPELPATTLAGYCYISMFRDCTALTIAPELPATTLAGYCYNHMFNGCTSLTTAPELPATTLAENCYSYMFHGCTSLATITCLATDISAVNCTLNWVRNVAASGTFTKAASMSSWTAGKDGIPSDWTVRDAN